MDVAQSHPDSPCGLYTSPVFGGYLGKSLKSPSSLHKYTMRKRSSHAVWFRRKASEAYAVPPYIPTAPRAGRGSTVLSNAGIRKKKKVKKPPCRNDEQLHFPDVFHPYTAEPRSEQEGAVTGALLSNFVNVVRQHPLCLKTNGLNAKIYQMLYSERPQDAASDNQHSHDKTRCLLASGVHLQAPPSGTEPCDSMKTAIRLSAIKRALENPRDKANFHPHPSESLRREGCENLLPYQLVPRACPEGENGTHERKISAARRRSNQKNDEFCASRQDAADTYESHLSSTCVERIAEQRSPVVVADSAAADGAGGLHAGRSSSPNSFGVHPECASQFRSSGDPYVEASLGEESMHMGCADATKSLIPANVKGDHSSTPPTFFLLSGALTADKAKVLGSKNPIPLGGSSAAKAFHTSRALLPTQIARMYMILLAWKRVATERSLQRNISLAARLQTERQLLRRCILSFVQHKERQTQLHLKYDICTLHGLKHSAARHFTAWIRIFYAASARKAFLKSFAFSGLQASTHDRQQQCLCAEASHAQSLKLRVLKAVQGYVTRRRQARAAAHQAHTHHTRSMLRKGLYGWCRWHAYMGACIKLLRVASELEEQRVQRAKPVIFDLWKAETKRSRAAAGRALSQAIHFKVGRTFRAWWKRSVTTKLFRSKKKEYVLEVKKKTFRYWKVAYGANWRQQEAIKREVRQMRKRRGLVFLRVALMAWRRHTRRRLELSHACTSVENKRKQRLLQKCKTAAFLSSISRRLSTSAALRSISKALAVWKAYARRHKRERFIKFFFFKQREKNVKHIVWVAWRRLLASTQLSRKYFVKYVLRNVYNGWRDLQTKRNSLKRAERTWETRAALTRHRRYFEAWRQRACSLHATKTRVFSAWWCRTRRSRQERLAHAKVGHSRARRLILEYWLTWKALTHKRRHVHLVFEKRAARRVFAAVRLHTQKCKAVKARATQLTARTARNTCCRMLLFWLRQVYARRKTRTACETVMSIRRDCILSSVFHEWLRAAGLWSPWSNTLECFSSLFDKGNEVCSPSSADYLTSTPKTNVCAGRNRDRAWELQHRQLSHAGGVVERSSQLDAGGQRRKEVSLEQTQPQKKIVSKVGVIKSVSSHGVRRKPTREYFNRELERTNSLVRKGSANTSNDSGLSHLSSVSRVATTASDFSQRKPKTRPSAGRRQVYVDFFWDGKLSKIFAAWREAVHHQSRYAEIKKASRFARPLTEACSVIDERYLAENTSIPSKRERARSANRGDPRFADECADEVPRYHVAVSPLMSHGQHKSQFVLKQVLLFKRRHAKRHAFESWVAFCNAKNTIVSKLEDEFRALRCLRRWRQELSRRLSLRALAHVQTHYLNDLDADWPPASAGRLVVGATV